MCSEVSLSMGDTDVTWGGGGDLWFSAELGTR